MVNHWFIFVSYYQWNCIWIVFPRVPMKPWKEGDGAVEKFILITVAEWDDGSRFPVQPHPVVPSYWVRSLDLVVLQPFLGWSRSHVHQTRSPSLGTEPLCCQKVRDRNRKLHAFEKLFFFSVWTNTKTIWILCKLLFLGVFPISVTKVWRWLCCFCICTIIVIL